MSRGRVRLSIPLCMLLLAGPFGLDAALFQGVAIGAKRGKFHDENDSRGCRFFDDRRRPHDGSRSIGPAIRGTHRIRFRGRASSGRDRVRAVPCPVVILSPKNRKEIGQQLR